MDRFDCPFEIKLVGSETDAGAMTFRGYGAVFNNVDAYGDVILKGAFKQTIREAKSSKQWPAMLMQHGGWGMSADDLNPIGIWTEMDEDDTGLAVEGKLADTDRGREMYTLLKMQPRPAINGLSIGYFAKEFTLGSKPDEPRRTIKKIELMEISPVTFPANPKARVKDVKAIEQISSLADAERYLRDACRLSRSEAVAFMSRIKGVGQSDSGDLALRSSSGQSDSDPFVDLRAAILRRGSSIPA